MKTGYFHRRLSALALTSLLALPLSSALATTYYVDSVAGLDTYSGQSTSTPWQTLTKVNALAIQPGDTILFKRGCAWSGFLAPQNAQGTSIAPIVFDAYGTGAAPIINGVNTDNAVLIWSAKYFTFQNFTVTNDGSYDKGRCGIRINFAAPAGQYREFPSVNILNNEVHNVRGITVRSPSSSPYSSAAIYIDMQDTPTTGALFQVKVIDLLVQGNDVHDNRCIGFNMKAPTSYGSHPELWATNFKIRQNVFDQGGADHIVINGANAPLIEYNAGYDAGRVDLETYPSNSFVAGMWTAYFTKDAIFQFNEVARTHHENIHGASGDSQAFDADLGTSGTHTFQYNYTHDNEGGVLIMMYENLAKTVVYRYNLSVNDARNTNSGCQFAIYPIYGVNSALVYNNVIYSTRQEGFKFLDIQGAYFYNNIFDMPAAIYPTKPIFSNNCYFGHTPSETDLYKVVADPQFVGPLPTTAGGDGYLAANTDVFKLQSTSPCINAGVSVANNGGRDFWNNPLYAGTYADIGMHEVVGGNRPAPAAITITDDPAIPNIVIYTGAWSHTGDSNFYNGTKSWSNAAGDSVQFNFTGTNVAIYGGMGNGFAQINVSVDSGPAVLVNCYTPLAALVRVPLFQISGLTNAAHTIKATTVAKYSGSSWNTIAIDSFQQAPGTPPSSPIVNTVDATPSASLFYTGTWTAGTGDTKCYNGTKSTSATVTDHADFSFTGTGVRLFGIKASNYGKLSIAVDGGAPTLVNCYQPTLTDYLVKLYEINGLAAGSHTLVATVATKDAASTGNTVAIDYFQALTGGGTTVTAPIADAYVRDGTYAGANYGADPALVTKLDGTSYQRETFLKFNVSGMANAGSAKLQLMPTAVGTDMAVTYTVEWVTNDTWTETGVTWNTKPAGSGVVLATLSGSAIQVGVPVSIDITNQVRSEAAGDGVISIRIRSNNTGSLKQVTFGSKEDVTANRPQLLTQ